VAFSKLRAVYGNGRGWLAGDWPSTGAFSTLLRRPGLRASSDGVLATKSERKMLASTCLYSLYAWLLFCMASGSCSFVVHVLCTVCMKAITCRGVAEFKEEAQLSQSDCVTHYVS